MVTYSTNELIPSSEFEKKFGTYLAQIKDNSVEKLAILKNNKVEAVIISKDEYENMKEALTQIEAKKNLQSIQSGLDDIKNGNYHLINLKYSLKEYNQVNVDDDLSKRILNGQILEDIYGNKPVVFIYKDNVIGIYQEYQDNKLKPLHIFN